MKVILSIVTLLVLTSIANATVVWQYSSPLTVTETITDIGGGDWQYEYSFQNVDTSPIWMFGIYLPFQTYEGSSYESSFTGCSSWNLDHDDIDLVSQQYDGRNLDSNIIKLVTTYTEPVLDETTAIPLSASVSGFHFTASVLDTSPKHYFYETIASGFAWNTGEVAAVGTTVPEPSTIVMLGIGCLTLGRRKRF